MTIKTTAYSTTRSLKILKTSVDKIEEVKEYSPLLAQVLEAIFVGDEADTAPSLRRHLGLHDARLHAGAIVGWTASRGQLASSRLWRKKTKITRLEGLDDEM